MLNCFISTFKAACLGILLSILLLNGHAIAEETTTIVIDSNTISYSLKEKDLEKAPEWAKHAVWYQIFPERFWSGDPNNDPTVEDIKDAFPGDLSSPDNPHPWHIHPWTSDWFELQPYEQGNDLYFWKKTYWRRYGGDLQGILDKLDYLQDLGINAIYLNPVFQAPSSHKYDTTLYHHIDPTFGPDPEGDRRLIAAENPDDPQTWPWTAADRLMLELIDALHARGMHIILDGVFNHIGHTNWAFQDVKRTQQRSPYRDWFVVKSWRDNKTQTPFKYAFWEDEVPELPVLRQDERGTVEGPKNYIFAITQRWLDPNGDGNPADGIDGWRLDAPFNIQHAFWEDWRRWVRSINPEAYIVGEMQDTVENLQPYLEGDEFDAVMNYNFPYAYAEHFFEQQVHISLSMFDYYLKKLREELNPETAYVMQNLFGSHDTARIASHIVNADIGHFRDWSSNIGIQDNHFYQNRKPNAQELQQQKLFAILQMTYIGAPMIYYGDEAGMWGGTDPHCRKPMIWPDLVYEPEQYEANGRPRLKPDSVEFNTDLFEHYRNLIHMRHRYPVLRTGDFRQLYLDDRNDVYIFARTATDPSDSNPVVIVALNNSFEPQTVNLISKKLNRLPLHNLPQHRWIDIFNDSLISSFNEDDGEAIELTIPPQWASILVSENL